MKEAQPKSNEQGEKKDNKRERPEDVAKAEKAQSPDYVGGTK